MIVGKGSKTNKRASKRLMEQVALAAVLTVLLSGCGALDRSNKDAAEQLPAAAGAADMKASSTSQSALANGSSNGAPMESAKAEAKADSLQAADSFNGSSLASAVDRKIIYKANVTMQVERYADAQAKIEEAVSQSGAYILQFSENETTYEKSGSFVIKVPANGFQSLLGQLEKINPSVKKNMQGQDVSEEFVDLTSRLKAKQVVESRLIAFMEKSAKTDELLAFSNELGKVQEEIERIKGRMRYLEQNVSYSTIEVRIAQKLGSAAVLQSQDHGPLYQRAAEALNSSLAVMMAALQWVIVGAAATLPVAFLLALIGLPIWLIRRSRKKKLVAIRRRLSEEAGEQELILSQERPNKDNEI